MDDVKDPDNVFDDADGDSAGESESGEATPAPPAPVAGGTSDSDRINDLMSKWQSDQARANRAESELAALKSSGVAGGKKGEGAVPPAASAPESEFVEFARDHTRRLLYESEPRLAAYQIEPNAIEGSTVGEMEASLARQRTMLDAIESRVRNEVMTEHGIDPALGGGSGEKPRDFSTMPAEEFEKYVSRAKGGL